MHLRHRRAVQRIVFVPALALLVTGLWGATLIRAASVTVTVGTHEGARGDEVKIPIQAAGATDLGALQLDLTYDPAILEVVQVDKGSLMPDNVLLDSNPAEPGRLKIGFVTTENISGDGELLVARFKVLGEKDQSTTLGIENAKAWEGTTDLFDMLVTTQSGQFTVTSKSAFPWLLIIIAAIVVVILLFLLSRRRRAQPAVAVAGAPAAVDEPARVAAVPPEAPVAASPAVHVTSDGPRFCDNCGAPLNPGAQFCSACGTRVAG